jgi:hypothetical protein
MILTETLMPPQAVQLSNNDVVMPRLYSRLLFFYRRAIPAQQLRDSLKTLADSTDYSILYGAVTTLPDGTQQVVPSTRGIPFETETSSSVTLTQLDEQQWSHAATPAGLEPGVLFPPKNDVPVMQVKVTYTVDGGTVIGVGLFHTVLDGRACAELLQAWSAVCRGEEIGFTPCADRSVLRVQKDVDKGEHPEYKYVVPQPPVPFTLPGMTVKILYLSDQQLHALKDDAMRKLPEGEWVSSNDVLCAWLWRCVTRARIACMNISLDSTVAFGMACDGRPRLEPPIADGYIGCANFYIYASCTTKELIQPGGLARAAQIVRKAVDRMDHTHIQSALKWVDACENKAFIQPGFSSFLGVDLAFTNWSKFNYYNTDFGYGKPVRYRLPQGAWDGLVNILEAPRAQFNGGGVEVYLGLGTDCMDALQADSEFSHYTQGL